MVFQVVGSVLQEFWSSLGWQRPGYISLRFEMSPSLGLFGEKRPVGVCGKQQQDGDGLCGLVEGEAPLASCVWCQVSEGDVAMTKAMHRPRGSLCNCSIWETIRKDSGLSTPAKCYSLSQFLVLGAPGSRDLALTLK